MGLMFFCSLFGRDAKFSHDVFLSKYAPLSQQYEFEEIHAAFGRLIFISELKNKYLSKKNTEDTFCFLYGRIFNLNNLIKNHGAINNPLELLISLRKKYQGELGSVLRGDFLLGFVCLKTGALELIHSPFSHTMAYFTQPEKAGLYFSNSCSLLKKFLLTSPVISKNKFLDSLSRSYQYADRTFYENIFNSLGGHILHWLPGQPIGSIQQKAYWQPKQEIIARPIKEHVETIRFLLEQAVSNRLPVESLELEKVCCELSGGLDSSAVTALLAKNKNLKKIYGLVDYTEVQNRPSALKLLPAVTNHRQIEDFQSYYQNIEIHRCDGFSVPVTYSELTRFCLEYGAGPEHAPGNVLWIFYFYQWAAQQGISYLFTGRRGDLAFSFKQTVPARNLWNVIRPILVHVKHNIQPRAQILKKRYWDLYYPVGAPMKKAKDLAEKRCLSVDFGNRCSSAFSCFNSAASAAFDIIFCDPTADQDLIDYCLSVPPEFYLNHINKGGRYLARKAIEDILPPSIVWNKTKGIQAAHWYAPLKKEMNYYQALLKDFAKHDLISECVDLNYLKKLLYQFETQPLHKLTKLHKFVLLNTLHVCEWVFLNK